MTSHTKVHQLNSNEITEANADFIVLACNAHEALMTALKEAAFDIGCSLRGGQSQELAPTLSRLEAAIAKAMKPPTQGGSDATHPAPQ